MEECRAELDASGRRDAKKARRRRSMPLLGQQQLAKWMVAATGAAWDLHHCADSRRVALRHSASAFRRLELLRAVRP
jgi:hypothetical protein